MGVSQGNMRDIGPVRVGQEKLRGGDWWRLRAGLHLAVGGASTTEAGLLGISRPMGSARPLGLDVCRKNPFPRTLTPAGSPDRRSTIHIEVRLTVLSKSALDTGATKNMSHAWFFDYLLNKGVITEDARDLLGGFSSWAREPIGMIAVQHGLIRNNDIDRVLDAQRSSTLRFGDLAIEMKLLSRPQVDRLLEVQSFRMMTDLFEALVLAGLLEYHEALKHLQQFIDQLRDAEPCVESSAC